MAVVESGNIHPYLFSQAQLTVVFIRLTRRKFSFRKPIIGPLLLVFSLNEHLPATRCEGPGSASAWSLQLMESLDVLYSDRFAEFVPRID